MSKIAIPFLDSIGEADEHGPSRGALARPWKAYWPPESGSKLHSMLEESLPEVLTWRFNPQNPFDRPWQSWTRSAILGNSKTCAPKVLTPVSGEANYCHRNDPCSSDRNNPEAPINEQNQGESSEKLLPVSASEEGRWLGTQSLDSMIAALSLPYVTPLQFNYLSNDPTYITTKPYHTRLPFMGEIRRSNIVAQGYSGIRIHDIRGHEDAFLLAESGFEFRKVPVDISQWSNDTARYEYLPLMERWLKDFFGARRVFIFTYTFRCENRDRTPTEAWVGPYMRAHADVTLNSGIRRLNLHLPEEADGIKNGRWQIVGLWRALTGPHQDRPLAVLHNKSLSQQDLVGADVVFPHYCDEGYEVKHSAHHRWFYKSRMDSDEALLFMLYDSSKDHVRFCPHGSFIHPSVPEDTPQRASIELRAIIVH